MHMDKDSIGPTNASQINLDKIFEELDNLNSNDMDLTTRIQYLEKALKGSLGTIKIHTTEINELKLNSGPMEPIKTDGPIDTSAIFAKIKQVEVQLMSFREKTDSEFVDVRGDMEKMKVDYKAYTDKAVSDLNDRLTYKYDQAIKGLNHDLEMLRAESEQQKKAHDALELRVAALEKKIQAILDKLSTMGNNTGGPVMDDGRIANLERRVQALEDALEALKNDIARWIKELQDMINQKPDYDVLEKMIQDRFNEIVKALTKQFADKGETRKALKMHEKQLQNVYNIVLTRCGGGNDQEEDAMFMKKPLKGLSCASCEKGLENMYGKRVEFMAWNKLPFRDPQERIARVGQGFSKMLSMLNPDQLSRYEQGSKMGGYAQQPMHSSQNDPNFGQQEMYDGQLPQMRNTTHGGNFNNKMASDSKKNRPGSTRASRSKK